MITYIYGDVLDSPAQVLVNPVNTTGTMATGMGADLKRIYPAMFTAYQELCQSDNFEIGQLMLYRAPYKWILNVPVKKHPRANSKLEYLEAGLQKFASTYADYGYNSVSFPMLGVEDGLTWDEVRPLMEAFLRSLPIMVYIHLNEPTPFRENTHLTTLTKRLTSAPQHLTRIAFLRDLKRVAQKHPTLTTLGDNPQAFTVSYQEKFDRKTKEKRASLIFQQGHDETFVPESMLTDLWRYLVLAGYVLPQNLPGGMDAIAPWLVALVAHLDEVRPMMIEPDGGKPTIGLHYIPPVGKDDAHHVTLA